MKLIKEIPIDEENVVICSIKEMNIEGLEEVEKVCYLCGKAIFCSTSNAHKRAQFVCQFCGISLLKGMKNQDTHITKESLAEIMKLGCFNGYDPEAVIKLFEMLINKEVEKNERRTEEPEEKH